MPAACAGASALLQVCPYFLSRDMAGTADVIFMPYNYLVDAQVRDAATVLRCEMQATTVCDVLCAEECLRWLFTERAVAETQALLRSLHDVIFMPYNYHVDAQVWEAGLLLSISCLVSKSCCVRSWLAVAAANRLG
jgi:hypothetical protein